MFWRLTAFPKCRYHAFLSHCREDRPALVWPVYERLKVAGVSPWLDREDYYYGRDSRTALSDAIADCRHVIFFVTDAMIVTGRGWCVLELGYAELLQASLQHPGRPLANIILPLFLVPHDDARLPETVWQATRDRGRFFQPASDGDPVDWCVREVVEFLQREQRLSATFARVVKDDPTLNSQLSATPGLLDRVTKFAPAKLPPG